MKYKVFIGSAYSNPTYVGNYTADSELQAETMALDNHTCLCDEAWDEHLMCTSECTCYAITMPIADEAEVQHELDEVVNHLYRKDRQISNIIKEYSRLGELEVERMLLLQKEINLLTRRLKMARENVDTIPNL